MKLFSLILTFSLSFASHGQADNIDSERLNFEYDSSDVTVWKIHFKELSFQGDSVYPSRILAHSKLNGSQSSEILKSLKDKDSFDGTRANLSHHDIIIQFYHFGEVVLRVQISAMTGNIDISNSSNDYSFRNNCSSTFGAYLKVLLNELDIIEAVGYDEIDLEGLN